MLPSIQETGTIGCPLEEVAQNLLILIIRGLQRGNNYISNRIQSVVIDGIELAILEYSFQCAWWLSFRTYIIYHRYITPGEDTLPTWHNSSCLCRWHTFVFVGWHWWNWRYIFWGWGMASVIFVCGWQLGLLHLRNDKTLANFCMNRNNDSCRR